MFYFNAETIMKKIFLSFLCILLASVNGFSQYAYTPPDGTFTLAMGPNDDGSTSSISIPFGFCLYGTTYTSLFINNNGNVSFGSSYGSFSSSPFPSSSYVMLAAFWADVDTRSAGTVQYKITPTAMFINWSGVGYFPSQSDKVNTFQLVITDGLDPVLPAGSNIAFYYGDMQWTTGSASSGVNGFGGISATVGINKGDGINYDQIGRFDQAGSSFAGATDSHSGVDWLDNKSFFFNCCTLPTASISGAATVCNNSASPDVTFTGGGAAAPYTFTYTINGGAVQTITTTSGNSVTVAVPTAVTGSYTYSLLSVAYSGSTTPAQTQGSAIVTVNPCTLATAVIAGTTAVCVNDPAPDITFTGAAGTAPYTFTYTLNSGTAQTIITTSGNTVTIAAPTTAAGTFTYSLVSVQDVSSTTPALASGTATITVSLPAASIIGTASVCKDGAAPDITFTGSGGTAPYTFTYSINNGTNQTAISTGTTAVLSASSAVPGVFTYNLLNVQDASASPCSNVQTGTAVITVNPLPTASIRGAATLCKNAAAPLITLKGAGGTAPYTFIYTINGTVQPALTTGGSDSSNITAPTGTAGIFIYALVSVQDASSTTCLQAQNGSAVITVNPNPVAAFSSTKVCLTNSTQLSDSSTTSTGSISSWVWNLGDGSALNTSQSPSHTYTAAGTYPVKLTVINNFGCRDSITKPVKVYYIPTSGFTHVDVCFRDSMHFVNTSSINPASSIASYLWVFGDGGATSNLLNPAHYYSSSGIFNTTLICTSADGCSSVVNLAVKAYAPPVSAFTAGNACLHDSAHFTNTSVNPPGASIANWSWNFGDGPAVNTTTLSPAHLYAAYGHYTVTLITHSTNLGCADTTRDTVTVFPKPSAGFNFTNVCLNRAMNFTDASSVLIDTITNWSWNFGSGQPLNSSQNPSCIYPNSGIHNVTLTVTTNNGCKDSIIKTVKVHPLPNIHFTAGSACDGTAVQFTNTASIPAGDTLHSYVWNLGDGSALDINHNTTHLYAAAGSYPVKLTAVSNFGCADSITQNAVVNPNPVVNFTSSDSAGCAPVCTSFQDLSTVASGTNVYWQWNLGDGSSLNTAHNPNHCYGNDSVYARNFFSVTLTVTTDSGCYAFKTIHNIVTTYPYPKAHFTADPEIETVINPVISFKNSSPGTDLWSWNFGDSDTSSLQNPGTHFYKDTGTYKITLVTSSQYGCVDTTHQTISIKPDYVFYIPNTFTPNGDGKNDFFSGKGVSFKEYEMMIFDRWGNLVFYTDDINKQWDGMVNHSSDKPQQDIYVYIINTTDIKKEKHSYQGIVTLIR